MKSKIIAMVAFIFYTTAISAQEKQKKIETIEFKVFGVCDMCKERIENAALIKGVKHTQWNKHSGVIKVVYNVNKVTVNDIHKSVADSGHDTDKFKSSEKNYNKLPQCCAYRDGVQTH